MKKLILLLLFTFVLENIAVAEINISQEVVVTKVEELHDAIYKRDIETYISYWKPGVVDTFGKGAFEDMIEFVPTYYGQLESFELLGRIQREKNRYQYLFKAKYDKRAYESIISLIVEIDSGTLYVLGFQMN